MRNRWHPTARLARHRKRPEAGGGPDAVRTAPPARTADGTAPVGTADGTAPARGAGTRGRLRRLLTWRKLLAVGLALLLLPTAAFAVLYVSIDVPEANEQARAESNVYLYSDGTVAARTGEINRETVPIGRVPEGVRHAFIAAENKSFYEDAGLDPVGLARGVVNTALGKGTQGGSTITQQYVKNYYLSQEQTLSRKVREMVISLKVDRRKSKDDILAGYLNSSYFGRVAYGVQAAARAYYDRNVEELTVPQGAYLAALLQAPSRYDWATASPAGRRHVEARWGYVLDNMVDKGWLDGKERKGMRFPEPTAPEPGPGLSGQSGYFVDAARQELLESGVSDQELAAGGWTITLTLDRERQQALERAVARRLDGESDGERDGENGPNKGSGGGASRDVQAGAVSVAPETGHVVALYGGRDYTRHYLNNATRADYQAGPAFHAISLAASLERKTRQAEPRAGRAAERVPEHELVRDTAVDLGVHPDTERYDAERATELGLLGVSPMELAGVYATLGRHGDKVTPSLVESAVRGGERVELRDAVGGRAVARETADSITNGIGGMPVPSGPDGPYEPYGPFEAPYGEGTGKGRPADGGSSTRRAMAPAGTAVPPTPAALVSGPSDDDKAAWSVGYSPELATVVGVFGEEHRSREQAALTKAQARMAVGIWDEYSRAALGG